MNLRTLAASAALTLWAGTCAFAQTAVVPASPGSGSVLCSDVMAMDSASQTAFLKGYQAGRNEAAMAPGAMDSDMTTTTTSGTTADTEAPPVADGSTPATTGTVGADTKGAAPTADASATASTSTAAKADATSAPATSATDFTALVASCGTAPDSSISSLMTTP